VGGCTVAVGRTIGVRVGDDEATGAGLSSALAGLGPALVVLDDADGVAGTIGPTLTRWLEAAPALRIAVTCRAVLHADGERIVEVGPLARRAAVALLRQRAGARGAAWDDDRVVGELADRLDRLPLALELAAGRAGTLGPRQLLERLDDRFRLLGTRGRNARQATLRAVLESSFASLQPWERDAMAQLSVFRGGFRLEHAEEVVDLSAWPEAPWILDVVSRLWETSLVRSRDQGGQPRFHVLESVREFAAAELAASGTADAVRLRHARAFVPMDEDHETPGRSRFPMAERIAELENLVAALDTALASDDGVLAAHLCIATNAIVRHVAPVRRAIERTGELLERFSIPPLLRARAIASRGILLHQAHDDAAAEHDLRTAAETYVRLGERWRRAAALNNLGAVLRTLGRPDEARAQYEAVIAIARSIGAPVLEASAEANLGALDGKPGSADVRFRRAAELLERAGPGHDVSLDATVFGNLASLAMIRRDPDEAVTWAEKQLDVSRAARLRKAAHAAEELLAAASELRGDLAAMRTHLEAAVRLADDVGDRALAARDELRLARWGLLAGEIEAARRFARGALDRLGRGATGPLVEIAEGVAALRPDVDPALATAMAADVEQRLGEDR
jgi:predicted ATPase